MWALIVELSGGLGKLLLVGSITLTEPDGLMQRITSADEKKTRDKHIRLAVGTLRDRFFQSRLNQPFTFEKMPGLS